MPFLQSIRLAFRRLRQNPSFSILAISTLALGIGLNSAVFSVVSDLLLRPLAVAEPERLVNIYTFEDEGALNHAPMAYPDFEDLTRGNRSFSGLAAFTLASVAVEAGAQTELVMGWSVSESYFDVLGVKAARGRLWSASEGNSQASEAQVVVSYSAWQKRFGGDPGIVGRTVRINGQIFEVAGVAPPDFHGLAHGLEPEIWLPMELSEHLGMGSIMNFGDQTPGLSRLQDRALRWHWVVGRLAEGVELESASEELNAFGLSLAEKYPESNEERRFTVTLTESVRFLPGIDQALWAGALVLLAFVALVLLIACANLANMLLARAVARRQEMATRQALGASARQLAEQLLVEAGVLSGAGALAGLGVAFIAHRALAAVDWGLPFQIGLGSTLDGGVLLFTLVISATTALFFGLTPLSEARRAAPHLGSESRGMPMGRRGVRGALVVAQVAFSLLLLVCAGLALRSLENARGLDPGFEVEGLVVARFSPGLQGYDAERSQAFYRQLQERLATLPGTVAVTEANHLPLTLNITTEEVAVAGTSEENEELWLQADISLVGEGYFQTLHIPLLSGRAFDSRDRVGAATVAVVNETLAKHLWPGQDPLGRHLEISGTDTSLEVIGVVPTARYRTLGEEDRAFFYRPLAQVERTSRTVIVRARGTAAQVMLELRQAVREIDPSLAISGVESAEEAMAGSLTVPRLGASLFGLFGAVGLTLALLGLYGVLSYLVVQRTPEIGIRMALGARAKDVLSLVLGEGLRLTLWGIGCGLCLSLLGTRVLDSMLYGVAPQDPLTLIGVAVLFLVVAGLAAWVPARRATRVDPLRSLRHG